MLFRPYNPDHDFPACRRIFHEVGWTDLSDEPRIAALEARFKVGRTLVAEIDGEAECVVHCAPGTMQYLDQALPYSGVTAVATSVVARKLGIAGRLTARAVAEEAAAGAIVSGLGVFEQGFYDLLGFGTGTYDHIVALDPQRLTCPFPNRSPKRLLAEHFSVIHESRLRRSKQHGWLTFSPVEITHSDIRFMRASFGLGFFEGGDLTHHVWFRPIKLDHGPFFIPWMAYRTPQQFMELMGVVRSLGDQVRSVKIVEPAHFQLQDLVSHPLHEPHLRGESEYPAGTRTSAEWQIRINDIPACISQTRLDCSPVRFNLVITDPIERYLPEGSAWRGCSGSYVVSLGPTSEAQLGRDSALPTLTASINAFTRVWLGVRPASGLAATDSLTGPPDLLRALDQAFRLPVPKRDWLF